jgi:hypothetical protein
MTKNDSDVGVAQYNPIRVGGGVLFGAFNEQQYLHRLRCANGQSPQSVRIGRLSVEGAIGPIDAYELSGCSRPAAYRYTLSHRLCEALLFRPTLDPNCGVRSASFVATSEVSLKAPTREEGGPIAGDRATGGHRSAAPRLPPAETLTRTD